MFPRLSVNSLRDTRNRNTLITNLAKSFMASGAFVNLLVNRIANIGTIAPTVN